MDELEQAVYDFTLENLTKIIEAGVNVTMIQVGNELSNDFCGLREMYLTTR